MNLTVLLLLLSVASAASAMQIFVNRYGTIYTLEVDAGALISDVKIGIQSKTLDNPAAQILSFNGTVLENDKILSDYNIQKESTLTLTIQALIVTNTNDSGPGSLRQTIADATAGNTIAFHASLNGQTIKLQSELTINKNLSFVGNGVSNTIIDGDNATRLFYVDTNITASWTDLTLTQGHADANSSVGPRGGCIIGSNSSVLTLTRVTANACTATNSGGALWGYTINLTDSSVSNNVAVDSGGGLYGFTITITNSTLSGNSATFGGGIFLGLSGSLTLTNSTLSGNSASQEGGGIFGFDLTTQTIRHSTITANTAASQAGGIYSNFQVSLGHTILAGNSAGAFADAFLLSGTSAGHNRIGTISGFTSGTGDSTGGTLSSLNLGTLADNGGPTKTVALGVGSVALDAGDNTICAASPANGLDQRGVARPQGATCDIGAYEGFNTAPTFVGTATTLAVAQNSSATDIKGLLHASDADSGQTLTWTQSSAPAHGTLSIGSATASSGSTDITPGGTLTYTPTAGYVGSDSFTVQVSDGSHSATRTISVTISAPTVTVDALTLNSMVVGTVFVSQSFTAIGGHGSYTYDISAGALPAGLNLSTAGLLSGTPTAAGAYNFTVQATDSSTGDGPFSGTRTFSGSVAPAPVAGACGSSHGGTFTSAPAANLCSDASTPTVSVGNTSYTWTCAGSHGGTPASCLATRNYTVMTSAGAHGSISASQTVAYLATPSFSVIPNPGHTASVTGCGGTLSGTTYTTNPVTANCTVTASFQTATVTQTNIPTRATGVTASMVVSGCSAITSPTFIDAPSGAPNGTSFPFGLLGFTLTGCATGGTATVTVTYSQNLPTGATTFYKYQNGSYAPYTATLDANTNSVTFTLTDGGAGDNDGQQNDSITDPGGIGVQAAPTSPQTIPTLSEWGKILLSSLMAFFGIRQARRRA